MDNRQFQYFGLNEEEVNNSRKTHGTNTLKSKPQFGLLKVILGLFKEPMVVLLLITSSIYFLNKAYDDGLFLAFAILFVVAIEIYQNTRTKNALDKLKDLSQPKTLVYRNKIRSYIPSDELVVDDIIIVEEGAAITADAEILEYNDFSVNEAILTGESLAVYKDLLENKYIFKGTSVASGSATAKVTAVGNNTKIGKIGSSIDTIVVEKTPLEKQINNFIKKMVFAGVIFFLLVFIINFYKSGSLVSSLLQSLTLAMSILPEEIPVAFTSFMALGAWRLMKIGVVVKNMKTVETLGSATVICSDKTGTITENKMTLAATYSHLNRRVFEYQDKFLVGGESVVEMAMWASEITPFDPMEIALHKVYNEQNIEKTKPLYVMVKDYPLGGKPPMMTHVYQKPNEEYLVASKGAPEAIINVCSLSTEEMEEVCNVMDILTAKGYRLLGVASTTIKNVILPEDQTEFVFNFMGLVAFYDPPKRNIKNVLRDFETAGIQFKVITGDNLATTQAIAKQIGLINYEQGVVGVDLMKLSDQELQEKIKTTTIFARMFPEAKLKIVNVLKRDNEIVAMVGDGVNDGPALKAAHIGIAMGHKGTEIAKQAASLVLVEDDLSKMVDAIGMGRRIYSNLKKAVQYIISIHIPIILTVFLPLVLGWIYPAIFSPVHIIFLELIMGPTCSIIFENEPLEKNAMNQPPRSYTKTFLNFRELSTSVIQGLVITVGILFIYQWGVSEGAIEAEVRSMVFLTLISSNIFLTLVNRSFYYSVLHTLTYKNRLIPLMIGITILLVVFLFIIPSFSNFFGFTILNFEQILMSIFIGGIAVVWYELVKLIKRQKNNQIN